MSSGSTSNFLSKFAVADFGRVKGRRPRVGMTMLLGEVDHCNGVGLHSTTSGRRARIASTLLTGSGPS